MKNENIVSAILFGCLVLITIFTGVGAFGNKNSESLQGASFINDFSSVSRSTSVSIGPGGSKTVAEANPARQYMVISNNGNKVVYLNFGASAATVGSGILLSASSTIQIDQSALYTGAIQARSYSSTTVLVTEK
jgi:hypothetical protein